MSVPLLPPLRIPFRAIASVPWLRVADSSVFPDSLEVNPYLTVMALADRVAEGVRREIGAAAGAARA